MYTNQNSTTASIYQASSSWAYTLHGSEQVLNEWIKAGISGDFLKYMLNDKKNDASGTKLISNESFQKWFTTTLFDNILKSNMVML